MLYSYGPLRSKSPKPELTAKGWKGAAGEAKDTHKPAYTSNGHVAIDVGLCPQP